MTIAVHIVGDIIDYTTKLITAAMNPPEALLKSREKTTSFSELLQSPADFFSLLRDERMLIGR